MESLEYTFKQHYDAEQRWLAIHYWIGIPATLATATVAALATTSVPVAWVVGIASCASVLVGLITFLRPERNAMAHRQAATQLQGLHERIRGWIEVDRPSQEAGVQAERLSAFRAERNVLLGASPALPKWTYRRVKEGIEAGEAKFKADHK